MHAYTGYWSTSHYLAEQRKRLERERKLAAENRRKHRSLDRRSRLLRDLEAVDKKLRAFKRAPHPAETEYKRVLTLLRRRNRLVDALNAYVGTSQTVALEEV